MSELGGYLEVADCDLESDPRPGRGVNRAGFAGGRLV